MANTQHEALRATGPYEERGQTMTDDVDRIGGSDSSMASSPDKWELLARFFYDALVRLRKDTNSTLTEWENLTLIEQQSMTQAIKATVEAHKLLGESAEVDINDRSVGVRVFGQPRELDIDDPHACELRARF